MAEIKTNHKGMSEARSLSNDFLQWYLRRNHQEIHFDTQTQGGFIWDSKTHLPVAYIRSPFWRKEENDPQLHRNDIRPIFINPKESVSLDQLETGSELEVDTWDGSKSDGAPIMAKGSTVPARLKEMGNGDGFAEEDTLFEELHPNVKKIGFSSELKNECIELNFHHSPDPIQTTLAMVHSLKKLAQIVQEQGWNLTPIASTPHKPINAEETSSDPYVNRIAMEYMGWENVRHFIGSSFQVHVEMLDLESGLKAINMYQQVAPLLYAISLAGPFAHGLTHPNLHDIYIQDEQNPKRTNDLESYNALNTDDWMSIRYAGRWRGSPSGGSYITPLPENVQKFFARAEAGLNNNDPQSPENIPSPARTGGHHTDRVRVDIRPNGTLEISNMDTFGGNVLKLGAIQEFTKVLMWKLQLYAKSGKMQELSQRFPQLFPPQVTEATLRSAHMNSIEVAKKGVDAVLQTAVGEQESASTLFDQLLGFVNEPLLNQIQEIQYAGLPQGVTQELKNSALVPDESTFQQYRDADGVVSVEGFYQERSVGTLSHWLKERAKNLKELRQMSDSEAIKDCMDNLGTFYHSFIAGLNGNIKALFA
ncbi:MAG: glutamate-cysteine ligase family protein [Patescibacteria group bacterium]